MPFAGEILCVCLLDWCKKKCAALNDLNASDASRPTIEAPVLSPQTLDFSEVADSVGDSAWSCDEFGFPLTRPRVAPRMPEVSGVATDFRFLMRNE